MSNTKLSDSEKLLRIRSEIGASQAQLSEMTGINPSTVGRVENKKIPIDTEIEKSLVERLGVNPKFLSNEAEKPFKDGNKPESPPLTRKQKGLLAAAGLGPVFPAAAASLAIGIGVHEILEKLCRGYGAANIKELATKHLHISPSAISGWINRGKIPEEQLDKAINNKVITLDELRAKTEYFVINKHDFPDLLRSVCAEKNPMEMRSGDLIKLFEEKIEAYNNPPED
jgi:DNA-binding XRE family transcriptional regulator